MEGKKFLALLMIERKEPEEDFCKHDSEIIWRKLES
jgi:hypothetical protein